jgi:hypothetical protein
MLSTLLMVLPIPQTGFYFNIVVPFFPSNAKSEAAVNVPME